MWGVTARHVMDDVGRSPYISFPHRPEISGFTQILSVKEGNKTGADIAVFRIPPQLQPFLTPLKLSDKLPSAHEITSSAGFSRGQLQFFDKVEVLFASEHRILAGYQNFTVQSGYCGSPLIANGEAIGVFVGNTPAQTAKKASWYNILQTHQQPLQSFNSLVPASWVKQLTKEAQNPAQVAQKPIYLFENVIGALKANEFVQSIQLLRNGSLVKTLNTYPFMDYRHMERFLEVQQDDVIRVIVKQEDSASAKPRSVWYEWNSSTGSVSRTEVSQ